MAKRYYHRFSSEGAVMIMDNASFHRKKSSSPELNPIEHFWNWLKKKVSEYIATCKNLDNAISVAFKVW